MWYKKLEDFIDKRNISNRQFAVIMGYSEQMIGRYMKGTANINAEFISTLIAKFPEINLEYIFRDDYPENEEELNIVEESKSSFMNVDFELKKIEERIGEIRAHLKNNSLEK